MRAGASRSRTGLVVLALLGLAAVLAWLAGVGGSSGGDAAVLGARDEVSAETPALQAIEARSEPGVLAGKGELQPSAWDSKAATAPGTGRLVVRITWGSDQTPASGVGARAIFWDSAEPRLHPRDGVTDGQGEWLVPDAPPGTVTVYLDRGNGGNAEVRVGETTELALTLPQGSLVRVTVVDPDERVVPEAGITLSFGSFQDPLIVGRTDGSGRFALRDAGRGCFVGAVAPGHLPSVVVSVGDDQPGIQDVTLEVGWAGARLVGRVVDDQGQPIAHATVFVGTDQGWPVLDGGHNPRLRGPPQRRVLTDPTGAFEVLDLPRGVTLLAARAKGHSPWTTMLELQTGETTQQDIALPAAAVIEGVVADAQGRPVAGASVATDTYDDIAWVTTKSGTDGRFALAGVMTGTVDVVAQHQEFGKAKVRLELRAGQHVQWDPRLSLGLQIVGRVLDAADAPLPGLHVQAFCPVGNSTTYAKTDALGRFTLNNCGDGENRLSVFDWATATRVASLDGVRPGPDEVILRVLPREQPTAYLVGRVLDSGGRVPELTSVIAAAGETHAGDPRNIDSHTGAFRCGPLMPGEWDLVVLSQGHTNFHVGHFTLAPGETRDVGAVVLPAPARVVLRVRLDAGVTVDRIVCALDSKAGGPTGSLQLEEGTEPVWVSAPVEPGDYVVSLGSGSGGAEDAFVLAARADVHVEPGRDTPVELFAERGVAQGLHVTSLRSPPPKTTVIVTDAAGVEVQRRSVYWNDPRPGRSEHEGWVSFIGRPGGYTARIECEDGFVLEYGISVPGGVNIAPDVEVSVP